MKKHLGKKGLSLLLSLLMVLTAIPLAVVPAAAESATLSKSAWAVVSSGSGNQRYNSEAINVCNDGLAGNMSAGFMWFDISQLAGSVENATLSVKMRKNSSSSALESKIQIYSVDPSNSNLPSKANGADTSKFTTLFGTGYQTNSEANPNNVKNTLGVLNDTPIAEYKVCDLSTTATAKTVDLKSAIEKALLNGQSELCLMFIDHKSQNNGSPDWSDCWVYFSDASISCTYDPNVGGSLNASVSQSGVVYNGSGTRYDSSKLTVASDGEASNTTAGFLNFDISSVSGTIKSANLKVDLKRNTEAANVSVYAVDPTKVTVNGHQNGQFSAIFGSTYTGTAPFNKAKDYFGLADAPSVTISSSSLSTSQATSNLDVTSLVEYAVKKGYTTLCLMFIMPTAGGTSSNGGWTDVDVFYTTAKLTCSYDDTDFGTGKAAEVAKNNVTSVNSVKNLNTDVTTVNGSFPGDSTYLTADKYAETYHNVLYWGGVPSSGTNHTATTGTIQLGSSGTGSNSVAIYYYQPTVTLLYDGNTSDVPRFGVMVNSDPTKTGSWGTRCDHQNFYLDGDSKGFSFTENWHARVGAGNNLDFQWVWNSSDANARACYTYGKTDPWIQVGSTTGIANIMRFTGSMNDSELIRSFMPTYGAQFGNGSNYYTRTATASNTVAIINFVPLKKAIEEAKTELAKIKANPKKYTNTSVTRYVEAAKALVAAKPNNYVNANTNNPGGYNTNASIAINNWNNRGQLAIQQYKITFKSANGTVAKEVSYDYETGVNCANIAPTTNSVTQIAGNATQHQTYKWNTEQYVTSVVDDVEINEVASTLANHNFGQWFANSDSSTHSRTCSDCGYVESAAHTAGDWQITKHESCTETGTKIKTCTVCGATLETATIAATGHVKSHLDTASVKAATCTEKGFSGNEVCDVCGVITAPGHETEALGHDFTDWAYSSDDKKPTCTKDGEQERHCKRDGCSEVEYKAVGAYGHTWKELPAKAATCTETGLTAGTYCTVCSVIGTKQETVPALGHSMGQWNVVKAATCTEEGSQTRTCLREGCDYSETEAIPATNHANKIHHDRIEPSCTKTGTIEYWECPTCNKNFSDEACTNEVSDLVIGKLDHDMGDWETVTDSTCTVAGTEKRTCKNCDYSETRELALKAHTEEEIPAVDATCTKTGLTAGVKCSVCGKILTEQKEIPAKGHTVVVDEAVAPTCEKTGLTEGSHCSVCNETLVAQEEVKALGHNYEGVVTAPTCVAEGYTTYTCTRCKDTYISDKTEALGHNMITDPAVDPTCTTTGLTEGSHCSRCDYKIAQEVIPATNHANKAYHEKVDPTCTEEGTIEYWSCPDCNKNFSDEACTIEVTDLAIKALGHTEETIPAKAATCTEKGLTAGVKCSVCGEILEAQKEIPAKGHTEEVIPAVDATCTSTGLTEGKKCSFCGKTLVAQEETPIIPHTPSEAVRENVNEATCSKEGSYDEVVYCSVCKTELSRNTVTVEKTAHTEEVIPAVAATCTSKGLTEGKKCSVCGEILVAQEETPMIDHTPATRQENKVEATCGKDGSFELVTYCTVCGTVLSRETKVIPATGEHNYVAVVTAPTCTTDGYTTHTCSICGETYTDSPVAKLGHSFTNYVPDGNATCTKDGTKTALCDNGCGTKDVIADKGSATGHKFTTGDDMKTFVEPTCEHAGAKGHYCTVCGEIDKVNYVEIPTLEHTFTSDWTVKKEATCVEAEVLENTCSVCGTTVTKEGKAALGHNFDGAQWVVTDEATCTHEGSKTRTCVNCGGAIKGGTQTETIAKKEHTIVKDAAVAPSCTEPGLSKGTHCSVCGEVIVAQQVVPATGHKDNDKDGHCDICGADVEVVCNCICHKTFFLMRLIYKIARVFWKLFGIAKTCDCGAIHY